MLCSSYVSILGQYWSGSRSPGLAQETSHRFKRLRGGDTDRIRIGAVDDARRKHIFGILGHQHRYFDGGHDGTVLVCSQKSIERRVIFSSLTIESTDSDSLTAAPVIKSTCGPSSCRIRRTGASGCAFSFMLPLLDLCIECAVFVHRANRHLGEIQMAIAADEKPTSTQFAQRGQCQRSGVAAQRAVVHGDVFQQQIFDIARPVLDRPHERVAISAEPERVADSSSLRIGFFAVPPRPNEPADRGARASS